MTLQRHKNTGKNYNSNANFTINFNKSHVEYAIKSYIVWN